ncbi:ABC transporter ATP-binding protein [Clostridium cylindrosporum]|uniref:ABC-type quaternary amine transporter n=1 Tax=Clostridium cylindrosporum DSM 605 TaxID=1121307 RepID=A0A0J8G426_CLOCY|nr:ABC transporter ATP-binding protein [Clostridium cylindrosporum]KMT22451.1 Fe(3+) ions import ATP-binding protein FbpC [Clostridium cylindrosporum DSM 605]
MQLIINNISKRFGEKYVVKDFNLNINKGEILSILGPSGCGKTTVLKMIGGFLHPYSGSIILDGEDITTLPPEKREVSTVFQSFALFPHMKVIDNIVYGLKFKGYSKREALKKGEEYLSLIGLIEERNSYPSTLSGGQKQRVALARSLILNPKVLLLDEALSSLDVNLRVKMRSEVKEIGKRFNTTMIFVTHDQDEALSISDKIAVMNMGCIQQIGSPREIYENPSNNFVRNFLGECNSIAIKDKEINIRPEKIRLISISEKNIVGKAVLNGIVRKKVFMGFYIQYEVELENKEVLTVRELDEKDEFCIEECVKVVI